VARSYAPNCDVSPVCPAPPSSSIIRACRPATDTGGCGTARTAA